jgi:hypothetical protein
MKFVDEPSELIDPHYLTFENLKDIEKLPQKLSLNEYNELEIRTVRNLLDEIFFLLENQEIKTLQRKICVESIMRPPSAIYEVYEENEEGEYVGVGEPIGFTKPQIGVFVQLLGSKFDQS